MNNIQNRIFACLLALLMIISLSACGVSSSEEEIMKHRWQDVSIIFQSETPNAGAVIKGCKFCGRCPVAMEICAKTEPENVEISPGHFVMCHKYAAVEDRI